jgi:type VI secretion system secreted protein Hcp
MAADIILVIDGVAGESKIKGYEDKIDVISQSWGVSNSSTVQFGGGGGTAKADFQPLTIVKRVDKATPTFVLKTANGTHFPKATLVLRKAGGGEPVEYLKYEMETVFVSSWQVSDSQNTDSFANEHVSLTFAKIKVTYTPQKADGSKDSPISITWNISKNAAE